VSNALAGGELDIYSQRTTLKDKPLPLKNGDLTPSTRGLGLIEGTNAAPSGSGGYRRHVSRFVDSRRKWPT